MHTQTTIRFTCPTQTHSHWKCICQVNVANRWYKNNGMIVNETKHQALILGKTGHNFCFLVNNSIDIFGMTIDNKFSFDNHVSAISKKINNQFNVMLRFWKLINKETLLKLYKAFILPHFYLAFLWCAQYRQSR